MSGTHAMPPHVSGLCYLDVWHSAGGTWAAPNEYPGLSYVWLSSGQSRILWDATRYQECGIVFSILHVDAVGFMSRLFPLRPPTGAQL